MLWNAIHKRKHNEKAAEWEFQAAIHGLKIEMKKIGADGELEKPKELSKEDQEFAENRMRLLLEKKKAEYGKSGKS
jgi:hypothetical protein